MSTSTVRLRGARSLLGAALLASAIAGCDDPVAPVAATDQLIFASSRDGAMQGSVPLTSVFRMNADGSGAVNLTNRPGLYGYLAVAPAGRTVIFELTPEGYIGSAGECATQVWSVGVDGSRLRQLTHGACSYMPRVSPDGRHVAFLRNNAVWVVETNGTGERLVSQAVPAVQPNACGEAPKVTVRTLGWTSASRLQFERHICLQGTTYYEVDTEGNGLTEVAYNASMAYLSPDGSRIAYVRNPYAVGASELVVMNTDGSNARTIATDASLPGRHRPSATVWSPDGTEIYYSNSAGHFIARADGLATRRIAAPWPEWNGAFQSWSADGSRLAFTLFADARTDVAVMNADGTGLVNLTAGSAGSSGQAVWVPR